MLNNKELQLLGSSLFFEGHPIELTDALLHRSHVENFCASETLYCAGDDPSQVYFVLEGVVQLIRGDAPHHAILSLRQPGDLVGLMANFCQQRHHATAKSVRASKLLAIPWDALQTMTESDPAFAGRALTQIADNTLEMVRHFERLQQLRITERLADYLLHIAADDTGPVELALPCDKGLIATYLGMERESFSRALKKLRPVGVESRGRKVTLNNLGALKQLRDSAHTIKAPAA